LTEEELAENDKLWAEEHGTRDAEGDEEDTNFRSAGITPGGISTDLEGLGGLEGDMGMEPGGIEGQAGIATPGQPAAPNAAGSSGAGGGI